jgi:hypothetical protein
VIRSLPPIAVLAAAAATVAGPAAAGSGECRLLGAMQRLDMVLERQLAGGGAAPGDAAAAAALARMRYAAAAADLRGSLPGLTPDLVARFLEGRAAVVELIGGPGQGPSAIALFERDEMRRLAEEVAGAAEALRCEASGRHADAAQTVEAQRSARQAPPPQGTQAPGARDAPPKGGGRPGAATRPPQTTLDLLLAFLVALALMGAAASVAARVRRDRRRRHQRFPCAVDVEMVVGHTRRPARIVDVSRSGAKLRLAAPPDAGCSVTLQSGAGALPFQVLWSNAHFAGGTFQPMLSRRALAAVLEADTATAAARKPQPA